MLEKPPDKKGTPSVLSYRSISIFTTRGHCLVALWSFIAKWFLNWLMSEMCLTFYSFLNFWIKCWILSWTWFGVLTVSLKIVFECYHKMLFLHKKIQSWDGLGTSSRTYNKTLTIRLLMLKRLRRMETLTSAQIYCTCNKTGIIWLANIVPDVWSVIGEIWKKNLMKSGQCFEGDHEKKI